MIGLVVFMVCLVEPWGLPNESYCIHDQHQLITTITVTSLVPRRGGGGAPGTHCLCMRLIATDFRGDHVHTRTYVYWWRHKLTALMCQLVFCLSEFLAAWYLEIKLKKGQVASNECVYRGNVHLCGYPPFPVSRFLPLPTRHFSLYLTV